jgi:hypothetical protein
VNESADPRTLTVTIPKTGPATLREYRYFATDRLVDVHGFPAVSVVHSNVDLVSGLTVRLPTMGVIFLTTQD